LNYTHLFFKISVTELYELAQHCCLSTNVYHVDSVPNKLFYQLGVELDFLDLDKILHQIDPMI